MGRVGSICKRQGNRAGSWKHAGEPRIRLFGHHSLQIGDHARTRVRTASTRDVNSIGSIEHQHVRRFKITLAAVETLRPHQVPVRVRFDRHPVKCRP